MTAIRGTVVKSSAATGVRPIVALDIQARTLVAAPEPGEVGTTMADELAERLARCETEISGHAAALDKAFADGEEAGKVAAEDMFEERREKALSMLAQAFDDAREDYRDALTGFETLALKAALQALRVIIGDPESYREILEGLIRKQVAELNSGSVLTMTVSRSDFPDSRELVELESSLGAPTGSLKLSDEMESGRCKIDLKIGAIELDMIHSLAEIADVLAPVVSDN